MIASLLLAALLPATLQPPPPFPKIETDAPSFSDVAPGVDYGAYDLQTANGPVVVHVLAIAPHAPNISLDAVLANDTLSSSGETLSSMAHRTSAIGGINGDYFDIGNTNQPTNIVVRSGALLRTPRKRYALLVTDTGERIVESAFDGTIDLGTHELALNAINEMPPPSGGAGLITPVFGPIAPHPNLALVQLAPQGGTPPFCTYRTIGIVDNTTALPAGYYLAGVVDAGDSVTIRGDLSPVPLAHVVAAVGGGPLLLDGGEPVVDPDGPNGAEYALRIPSSGAALAPDGTLYLLEVDGREPDRSIGVTRAEFAALMRAFGAVRGLAFDGGGSSELVAMSATQTQAIVQDHPSDGKERAIADGIFVYDTASPGPAAQIVAAPAAIHAVPGARVPLRVAFADRDDRVVSDSSVVDLRVEPASLGTIESGAFLASHAGTGFIAIHAGAFTRAVPVEVSDDPARVDILPHDPSAATNGTVTLRARAFDARGYALDLPPELPWRALHAAIDGHGVLQAQGSDALVSLLLGNHLANARVAVGYHDVAIDAAHPHVMTVPRDAPATVAEHAPCEACTSLDYALGSGERAAYLVVETPLPMETVAIGFDVLDDGKGATLKLALRNAINEEVLLSAGSLDRPGWRSVEVRLPPQLAQPARLTAFYVINAHAGTSESGTIAIRHVHAVVAGTSDSRP
jgi:hypothetical protein